MQHKWQLSAKPVLNTRRKDPQPHSIIVTFRSVVPELWGRNEYSVHAPEYNLNSEVPDQVAEVIQKVVNEKGGGARARGFHTSSPIQGAQAVYFNCITGRIDFPLGTPTKKVRDFATKLRAAVDDFAETSGIPYHQGELV